VPDFEVDELVRIEAKIIPGLCYPKLGSNNIGCSFTSPGFIIVHSKIDVDCAIVIAELVEFASSVVVFLNICACCDVSRLSSKLV